MLAGAMTESDFDPQHPWLGLNSFTEETRQFFFGRDEEVAELARRVQRKPLTVLFGQSGLGKTSIVRAGLVPRLRGEGYCPVYVRLDYGRDSPTPAEQIKGAILHETRAAGSWTRTGVAVEGESLWEFLHHRDDQLFDLNGRALTPLLIFDQFEEIFTLAQSNDFGRARAAEFVEELADLAENRPPRALEARLDEDDGIAERYDFARCDYRILIVLREDYLAHLEVLKSAMPSVTQNRMRIARMSGQQALDAVIKPGGRLVSREVAESIVRFVAGGSELANAEVEPSLLSLICRELNNARIAQGRSEISVDLLAGSHAGILNEFYERALADQPSAVRRFIEEELLTESGFRENIAEERVRKAFAEGGAAPDALARLVDRRLLRVEERLDVRRVELTHDVLCGVVASSRNARHEREAREAAELQLAEERAREEATRRALVRARKIAAGCAVLAVIAVVAGLYGYVSAQRAHRAEVAADKTRELAEQARGEAERLIVFLLDDFQRELEPVGRLDIVAELARRAIDYYEALPRELRTDETDRNRALALVRYGTVLRVQGNSQEAKKVLAGAVQTLDRLREKGDQSDITAIGLALGLSALALAQDSSGGDSASLPPSERAAKVLGPVASKTDSSSAVRRAYGTVLNALGFVQLRTNRTKDAVATLENSLAAYRSIDGLTADADAMARFGQSTSWLVEALILLGRNEEAQRVGTEGREAASRVLERQPTNMIALRARGLAVSGLANVAESEMRRADAVALFDASNRDWSTLVKVDPANAIAWNNLAANTLPAAWSLFYAGRPRDALAKALENEELVPVASKLRFPSPIMGYTFDSAAMFAGELGDLRAVARLRGMSGRFERAMLDDMQSGSFERESLELGFTIRTMEIANRSGDYAGALKLGVGVEERLAELKPPVESMKQNQNELLSEFLLQAGLAALYLNDYEQAEARFRSRAEVRSRLPQQTLVKRREDIDNAIYRAVALARLGRIDQARSLAQPSLALQRELYARRHDDAIQHLELARALYAAALADPAKAKALLGEAQMVMATLPSQMREMRSVIYWRDRIAEGLQAQR
jgi:tetratricopeptide (TPR) repeat protein